MAKRSASKAVLRGMIKDIYNSVPQPQPQEQPQMTPVYNSGLSKDEITKIYNQTSNTIPKLEQNLSTPSTTPSISDELERMKKAKADTTTPRTEGEQKAIDTYYDSLLKASGKQNTPTTNYKAEIDRMNQLKADTTANRTEGENQAIETYLNGLLEAQRYLDSQKKTSTSKKKTSTTKKTEVKKEPIVTVETKPDGTRQYTKTMSTNEKRDYERALLAQSKARGRALSPNEQRDYDRAQEAIARAKENAKQTTESKVVPAPTSASDNNIEQIQFGQLKQKPKATPTPGKMANAYVENLVNMGNEDVANDYIQGVNESYIKNKQKEKQATKDAIRQGLIHNNVPKYDERGFRTNESLANEFLNPNKKLNKEELAQAQHLVDEYLKSDIAWKNDNATTMLANGDIVPSYAVDDNGNYDPSKLKTPEEQAYETQMLALRDKISNADAVLYGSMKAIPGIGNLLANDKEWETTFANAQKQNPLAYTGGLLGTGVALNAAGQGMIGATKYGNALKNLFNADNSIVGSIAADALMDAPVDLTLDTIPQLMNDLQEGKRGDQIAKDMAGNIGLNMALNTLGGVANNSDDILRQLGKRSMFGGNADLPKLEGYDFFNALQGNPYAVNELNQLAKAPLDFGQMAAKNENIDDAVKSQAQATEELKRLSREIPETTVDPADVKVDTVNLKNGKKGYYIVEKEGDFGQKPVMPGKVFKSEEEAKNAMKEYLDNANQVAKGTEDTALSVIDNDLGKQADEAFKKDIAKDQELYRKLMNNEITYEEFAENVSDPEVLKYANPNVPIVPNGADVNPNSNMKVSQFAPNTMKKGTNLTADEYKKNVNLADFVYESKDEEKSMYDAFNMIADEGAEGIVKRLVTDDAKDLTQSEIDALMAITRTNNATARAMEAVGEDASAIRQQTNEIYKKLRQQATSKAQGLQALAKWTRNTPEGMLMYAENFINGKADVKGGVLQELALKLARMGKKHDFSPEFEARFLKEAEKLENIADMNSREAKDIMATLGRMINDEIPVKLPEKVTAFLMDNMLGNFRTLISRNAGGNLGLAAVEQTMTRPLAAGLDRLVSLKTGKRTQAGLSKEGLLEYLSGFKKGVLDELHDVKTGLHTARTGENTLENAISQNRHVFKSKLMDMRDSIIKNGLSVGDRPFYEANYKQTLGDYYRLRNMGKMGDIIQNLSDEDFKLYAETAAHLNALASVYQDDTVLSKALTGIKKDIGDLSRGALGFDILSQFTMPFVKTPANVVNRAIEYSPFGAFRNIARTRIEGGIGGKNFDQNRFVNETARNIIGSGLMYGAGKMAEKGLISEGYSDDKKVRKAQKEAGMQEHALNLPNNYQMDIGWIPVVGSNAVAGAVANEAFRNGDGNWLSNATDGAKAGFDSLIDQSMFQGLQRLFGTGDSYDNENSLGGNLINVVKSGLGQFVPSLDRQMGQVIDPYQRDMYNSNPELQFGPLENSDINSLINNVPILRQMALAPKIGLNGEPIKENQGRNVGMKVLEDMFLPGKLTEVNYSPLDEEAMRLQSLTGSEDAYRPSALGISKTNTLNLGTDDKAYDERGFELNPPKPMSNKEYAEYEQKFYKEISDMGDALINSQFYKDLTPKEQTQLLKDVYSGVKDAVNSEYTGKKLSGYAKTYSEAQDSKDTYDDRGFKITTNNGIQAVLEQAEAKNNPYGLKAERYNELKSEPNELKKFDGFKKALETYDLSDGKDTESAWLGNSLDGVYFGRGKEGVSKLAEYKKYTNAMNINDSKQAKEAFISGGRQGLVNLQNARQTAIDTGFVKKDGTANLDGYQDAYSVFGNETATKNYANFVNDMQKNELGKSASAYLPKLEAMNMTDEERGKYAYLYGGAPKEGSSAEQVFNEKGYEGYYLYRLLQNPEDFNGNGKKDKGDRIKTLYSWGLDQNSPDYNYYMGLSY